MRRVFGPALFVAAVLTIPQVSAAQGGEVSVPVVGGGISAPGWAGRIDAIEATKGLKLTDAKLAKTGDALMVTTGPAVTYWNPANTASGNYTVKATFKEDKFMALNDHAHPYGIVIAGSDMASDKPGFLYCAAYGDGRFIVRGFGVDSTGASKVFNMNARGGANPAINKAAGKGESVTQEIALSVKGDKVECAINGTVVGSYDTSAIVMPTRLKSTDGIYGIRFGHNTEAVVTGLSVTKN